MDHIATVQYRYLLKKASTLTVIRMSRTNGLATRVVCDINSLSIIVAKRCARDAAIAMIAMIDHEDVSALRLRRLS